jgi:hypothetical protein
MLDATAMEIMSFFIDVSIPLSADPKATIASAQISASTQTISAARLLARAKMATHNQKGMSALLYFCPN